ncbi:hypothetical protein Tco_0775885, partial [Tanacetum coccineum]
CTIEDGVPGISATIDRKVTVLVSEASIRIHLKLEDSKGAFSPQWKFFIHTILHCLSPKKTAWDQFSSNLATAIICLATKRIFNFSKFLFEALVKNINSQHKFLMYPRTKADKGNLQYCSYKANPQSEEVEEAINMIPLVVKSPTVSWKSYCKGDMGFYEIHRADGNYKTYKFFSEMLNDFDKDDLIVLYRLFNEKYASTRPGQELIEWKLYEFCGVHSLMLREVTIYMLVEKKYLLPQDTLTRMLRWKLHVNYEIPEMAYELLKFISLGEDCWELKSFYKFILLEGLSAAIED